MKSLENRRIRADILERIGRLAPESARRWGRMTAGQMVCHLGDSYQMAVGERPAPDRSSGWSRTWLKVRFLYLPVPWPRGLRTSPGNDAEGGGTPPTSFAADRQRLATALERFVRAAASGGCDRHPLFGRLTRRQWLRWGYLHADHHLRQFGV